MNLKRISFAICLFICIIALHHSFFWYLVIVTSIILSGCGAACQDFYILSRTFAYIVALSDYLQPLNYCVLDLLQRSLRDSSCAALIIVSLSKCGVSVPLSKIQCNSAKLHFVRVSRWWRMCTSTVGQFFP